MIICFAFLGTHGRTGHQVEGRGDSAEEHS